MGRSSSCGEGILSDLVVLEVRDCDRQSQTSKGLATELYTIQCNGSKFSLNSRMYSIGWLRDKGDACSLSRIMEDLDEGDAWSSA